MKFSKKILIGVVIILTSVFIISYGIIGLQYGNIVLKNKKNISDMEITKAKNEYTKTIEKEYETAKEDIMNILIVGSDAREGDKKSRSDTIIIFSIDKSDNDIKLISIMRDTYAKIPGYSEQKINHAFAYGGADLLRKTVEGNFNVKIDKYAVLDFGAFKDIINIIGGIDVELDEKEIVDLNNCMYGLKEKDIVEVVNIGMNHLNGTQALAYARMRHNGKGIYDRSKRQREIVGITIDKAKKLSLFKYPSIAKVLLKSIETDVSFNEALKLSYMIYSFKDIKINQMTIPPKELSTNVLLENKGWIIDCDKPTVGKIINDFIYKDIEYNTNKNNDKVN
ncbi:LCP family protein [Oceanirhabdus sp. W0125-5]|uniref:LCP family protein n=1 Tax=Oceanirhabdus sp. W0125-5 TaxID=2999116 RepID=UPI0022F2F834|nr:LCP family protein [Oceanirhabdus sp. W0125-5]WBW97540.1 LCP family protein [Oceanirhabdus sp. W0125-5]